MSLQTTGLIGVIVTLIVAIYAFKKHQLNEKGTIAAMLVGITIFALGGWTWFVLLATFFISSSLLSKFKNEQKQEYAKEHEKTDVRDAWQVLANSLFAAIVASVYFLYPKLEVLAVFVASVATVAADTWATELGMLDKKAYWILSGRKTNPGQSGAVSITGLAAAPVASLFVAAVAVALNVLNNIFVEKYSFEEVFATQFIGGMPFVAIVAFSGFVGSLVDSVLGATIQAQHYCPKCRKQTERLTHSCGTKTVLRKGFALVDNDAVNFLSSIAGGALAYVLARLFF